MAKVHGMTHPELISQHSEQVALALALALAFGLKSLFHEHSSNMGNFLTKTWEMAGCDSGSRNMAF
jgi:hypothetical protein